MQELRSAVFGDLKIEVEVKDGRPGNTFLKVGKKSMAISYNDLKALNDWLMSLFFKPVSEVISRAKEVADPLLAGRSFSSKDPDDREVDDPGVIDMAAMHGLTPPSKARFTLKDAPPITLKGNGQPSPKPSE